MAHIELRNLTKIYNGATDPILALDELNLSIQNGEFIVLVGPSGCGKSTTLRMLAGLESVTGGKIEMNGELINDQAPKDRDMALVFQNYALYPHKTVRGNMSFGLKLSTDLSDDEIDRRVEDAAALLGISDLLDMKPGALSGGQQQRVATGRAIVREPEVFLFDEPLSNLDAKLRKHMRTELARIHSELDITSVYVTHDQEEAMTLADRIVVLNDGQLQQVGTPKEVYYQPANEFVADFIGSPSMNFLDVELQTNDDGTGELVHGSRTYAVSEQIVRNIREMIDRPELVLGIRPENLTPVTASDASDGKVMSGQVDVVEVVGSDNFIYVDLDGKEWRIRTSSKREPEVNDTIKFTFEEDDVHLFDVDSGTALTHGLEKCAPAWQEATVDK